MSMTDDEVRKQLDDDEQMCWNLEMRLKQTTPSFFEDMFRKLAEERRRRKIAEGAEELLYDDLVRSSKSFEEYEREAEARLRSRGEL